MNLKGSIGKGNKREENPYLFYFKLLNFCPKTSPKNTSKYQQSQLHLNDNVPKPSMINVCFLVISCEFFKCEEF